VVSDAVGAPPGNGIANEGRKFDLLVNGPRRVRSPHKPRLTSIVTDWVDTAQAEWTLPNMLNAEASFTASLFEIAQWEASQRVVRAQPWEPSQIAECFIKCGSVNAQSAPN